MTTSTNSRALTSLTDLQLDPQSPNRGTERGTAALIESLTTYGAGRSILTDRTGTVIAGNKVLQQAQTLAWPIRVVETTGQELVVVQRTDLDLATDTVARQLSIADNRVGQLNLEWDPQVMAGFADTMDLTNLWTPEEMESLVGSGGGGGQTDDDAVVPLAATGIQPGDLFELGRHRLLYGDATVAADVARVRQDDTPTILITDPPYGVDYDPSWRVDMHPEGHHALGRVTNDDRVDWSEAFAHYPGAVAYVWHAGVHASTVAASLITGGFALRAQIIWVKPHFVLGRGDYHWQHEPCWYAVREGQPSGWKGDRTQSTVWQVPHLNPFGGGADAENPVTGHSTQKPVALYERPLLCHTAPGEVVYDPLVGRGTALKAAEKTGRR
jgi:DNA modification methylase